MNWRLTPRLRRLATVGAMLVMSGVGAPFGAERALADPQSHLRVHDGEILTGIAPPAAKQSTRVPEIVEGISPRVAGDEVGTSSQRVGRASRIAGQRSLANSGSPSSSFDWGAAGIGAGGALGLTLIVGGAALLICRCATPAL
jgi:hypothetical protein